MSDIEQVGRRAKAAAARVARTDGETRRRALRAMADALDAAGPKLLATNQADLDTADRNVMTAALIDRLTLNPKRLQGMSQGLRDIAEQPDPVGEVVESWSRPNGLRITKVRRPLGVVAVIYEARPNVTADVAGLCVMAGNAVVLRGSSHALRTNICATQVLRRAAEEAGLPADCVQLIEDTSREGALALMQAKQYIDLLVPRGGKALISSIERNATVPTIIDGDGNCHVYVDAAADAHKATDIVLNAKTSRPGVCNAAETLLVHKGLASSWLPGALDELAARGVEIRGDEQVVELWPTAKPADEQDWGTEYLDLILAVRIVDSVDEAIAHVNRWGTSNAEAIVTEDPAAASMFTQQVDSGTVFVNASTRFSDGGQFGFGAEIGISTQKLHARGPVGVRELTSCSYVVWGDGHIRN